MMFRGGVGIHSCGSLDYNRMGLGGHFLVAFLFFSLLFPSFPFHFFLFLNFFFRDQVSVCNQEWLGTRSNPPDSVSWVLEFTGMLESFSSALIYFLAWVMWKGVIQQNLCSSVEGETLILG